MNFKEATDRLFDGVHHTKLAEELGVSVATIRQARLGEDAKAHRNPPKEWQRSVIRLAEREMMRLRKLIEDIRQ